MNDQNEIIRSEIIEDLNPEIIRPLKMIVISLTAGAFIFFIIDLVIYSQKTPPSFSVHPQNIESFYRYLILLGIASAAIYASYFFLNKVYFSREKLIGFYNQPVQNLDTSKRIHKLFGVVVLTTIIRMALLEGVALFGLVLLLLSINNDVVFATNDVWLCTIPMILLIINAIRLFPNPDKLAAEMNRISKILADGAI